MSLAKSLVVVFIIVFPPAFAQGQEVDSLKRILARAEGTAKIDALNQLTYAYLTHDNKLAMQYCDQAIALSRNLEYDKGEGVAYTYKGVYEYLSREFSNGRTSLRTGLALAIASQDRANEGYTLFQLGNSYLDQAELDSAVVQFDQAYKVLKDSTNPVTLSKLYRNRSILYGLRAEYDLQDVYMEKCLSIRRLLGKQDLIADGLNILAGFSLRRGDYQKAKDLLHQVEEILHAHPEYHDELNDWRHEEALVLMRDKEFDKSLILFDSAKNYYLKTSRLLRLVSLEKDLGKVFFDRGEYELALKSLYDGLRVAKLKGYVFEVLDIQLQLGWVNYELGELNQSLAFSDSIYNKLHNRNMPIREADALTLMGVASIELRDLDKAQQCLQQVLAVWQKRNDNAKLSEAYLNLGNLQEALKNYNKANELYDRSYILAEKSKYDLGIAWSLLGLSSMQLKQQHYDAVGPLLTKAEVYSKSIGSSEALIRVYQIRASFLAAQGHYKDALYFANRSSQLKDSVHRQDLARRFISLQRLDEIEERDRNIRELTQDRQLAQEKISLQGLRLRQQYLLILAGGIGLALVGILALTYWRFYNRVKQFNQSIRSSNIRIQSQSDDLAKAHRELGELYRAVKDQKEEMESQADALTKSNNYINELNKNLEALVEQKTRDLQTSNEELIRHNHDLLQFSYSLSHHLRGPVARLLGLTTLIPYAASKEELDRMTTMVAKTSRDLDTVINDLSKVIDIRADLYHRKELTSLHEIWSDSYLLLQNVILDEFKITTDFSKAPEIVTIKTIVQSVFYNLLSNAIKYRSPDRPLQVVATSLTQNGSLILEIRDNGLGVDLTKYRDSVFKLFKRFHMHVESRGIGLYLVKSQLEALRGSIEIESEVDKGTLFRITIPHGELEVNVSL